MGQTERATHLSQARHTSSRISGAPLELGERLIDDWPSDPRALEPQDRLHGTCCHASSTSIATVQVNCYHLARSRYALKGTRRADVERYTIPAGLTAGRVDAGRLPASLDWRRNHGHPESPSCASSQRWASMAAAAPIPAEVITWRKWGSPTSPAAQTPSTLVCMRMLVLR